ncbi:MAG: hypothetical protein LUD79_08525 [Oscillospiraceae bacterium]|nr:hypothetical protein [Oscillospiraceae bacterium]
MKERNSVTAVSNLISIGAMAVTVLLFLTIQGRPTFQLWYPLIWLCFGPILYGLDCLFLRRERSVQALSLFNGGAGIVLFLGLLLLDGWQGTGALFVTGIGCLILSVQTARLCLQPVKLFSALQWLDGGLVVLVLFAAYLGAINATMLWAVPTAIGCGAAILGTLALRAGGRLSPQSWGFLAVLFAVLSGGVWLGANTISKGAGKGLLALWNGLKALGAALYEGLRRFMDWFVSIIPEQEYGELEQEASAISTSSATDYIEVAVPRFVYVLAVLLAVAVLVLLLRYVRRFRVRGTKISAQAVQKPRRSRISLWSALKRAVAWLEEGVRLRLYLRRKRNTALGAFYTLFRCAYGRAWREGAGESPREFLNELARRAGEDEALRAALLGLIPAVERTLYAPDGGEEGYPQAALLRKRKRALFPRWVKRRNRKNKQAPAQDE